MNNIDAQLEEALIILALTTQIGAHTDSYFLTVDGTPHEFSAKQILQKQDDIKWHKARTEARQLMKDMV